MPYLKPPTSYLMYHLYSRSLRIPLLIILLLLIIMTLFFTPNPSLTLSSLSASPVGISSSARLREIALDAHQDLVYLPKPDLLMMTMAKGGTTTLWNWLYLGMMGRPFNKSACDTYVQNVRHECWAGEGILFMNLSESEQWRVLAGGSTLRVAVQRDPFERLVSSWKSKFACEADKYGTDVHNRVRLVPSLLRQSEMELNVSCLSIGEFAEALERARLRAGVDAGWLSSTRRMDVHIRPQEFFWGEIEYDMVLDVRDLGDVGKLRKIVERLRYRALVEGGVQHRHKSLGGEVEIPESAAAKLYRFAIQSKIGEVKYME